MKKINVLKFALLIIFMFLLVGCQDEEEQPNNNGEEDPIVVVKEVDITEFTSVMKEELDGKEISKRIDLISSFSFSNDVFASITWESSDEDYLTNDGRYRLNTIGKDVKLTAHVFINDKMYDFNYTVYVKGYISKDEYLNAIYALIPDEIVKDVEFPTEDSEILRTRGITSQIVCESLDETLLSSDGKYLSQLGEDVIVPIRVTITNDEFSISGVCEKLVCGRDDKKYVSHAVEWLNRNFIAQRNVTSNIDLPKTDDKGVITFEYESKNQKVFNNYGELVNFIADTEVEFNVKIIMNDYYETASFKVKTLNRDKMIEYILDRMHVDEYQQFNLITFVKNSSSGTKFDDFGFLNFYVKDVSEKDLILKGSEEYGYTYGTKENNNNVNYKPVLHGIVPLSNTVNRPNYSKPSIEFITIHDTGDDYYDAAGWSVNVQTDHRQVSWHFTIDDHDIYQHLPLTEVAWHAGDGGNKFKLTDTGVKYAGKNPTLKFGDDGFLYINGVKSKLKAPYVNNKYQLKITPAGLYTELGSNGNYYINTYYYNSGYGVVSNGGGNHNSIGIETCINNNTRYSETMRACANLVAHMLKMYDLTIDRVMQHRNFSGKLCPQTMIRQNKFGDFIEGVEVELFILYNLDGAKFTYKSNNPDILGDDGKLSKYVTERTTVSYSVKVEYQDLVFEKTYETIIVPKN